MEAINRMRRNLADLEKKTLTIKAVGRYPTKAQTPVADVAMYQNNGTETIEPARFVERAEAAAGAWAEELSAAIGGVIDGDPAALRVAGEIIAADIIDMCDRIRTGRLKASFRAEVADES